MCFVYSKDHFRMNPFAEILVHTCKLLQLLTQQSRKVSENLAILRNTNREKKRVYQEATNRGDWIPLCCSNSKEPTELLLGKSKHRALTSAWQLMPRVFFYTAISFVMLATPLLKQVLRYQVTLLSEVMAVNDCLTFYCEVAEMDAFAGWVFTLSNWGAKRSSWLFFCSHTLRSDFPLEIYKAALTLYYTFIITSGIGKIELSSS